MWFSKKEKEVKVETPVLSIQEQAATALKEEEERQEA